jgi:alpha-L-arabinofuranosidase
MRYQVLSAIALGGALLSNIASSAAELESASLRRAAQSQSQPQSPDHPPADTVYLFTSFRGNGDGLHLAYSTDARNWTDLARLFLKPEVGSRLMRDPHILRGRDGLFHMVWTSGWGDKGIGYANSADLVNWSAQRYLPLMENTPGTKTCWAPEIFFDESADHYIIMWSSNIENPGVTPPKGGFHRAYYSLTKDFHSFTEPKMLFDPGFNNIDVTMIRQDGKYYIVFKETDDQPAGIWGRICGAVADRPLGPYTLLPEPIIQNERVEGPALVSMGTKTLLYVDYYVNHRYGVRETDDWKIWADVTSGASVVPGQRHGSILQISQEELRVLEPHLHRTPPAPVLPGLNADPHMAVFGDTFYLYPTTDGSEGWRSSSFSAWSSRDLLNWKNEGIILDLPRDLTWGSLHAWAPAIAAKSGKFYFYYSAGQNVGVAVANSPVGPFRDPLGKPLVAKSDFQGMQAIDPMVFVDDDGSAYLYWGQGRCKAVKLNEDMISFEIAAVRDLTPPGYNEGPFVHKRNGRYYLTWSEFDTRDPRYSVAYAVGDSPLGPFTKAAQNPILRQNGAVKGAGHHSIVQIPGRDEWIIAYHRFRIPDGNGYNRETCLSPLRHSSDGRILPVDVFEPVTLESAKMSAGIRRPEPVTTVKVDLNQDGKPISPDLIGIFFEDINYAADGGLYAELVQNRSFEYSPLIRNDWNPLTSWEEVARNGARGSLKIADAVPVHPNNPHYIVIETREPGGGFGLMNQGFDGIVVREGEQYVFSIFARQLFTGARWGGSGRPAHPARLVVRLENSSGEALAEQTFEVSGRDWQRLSASFSQTRSDDSARLVVLSQTTGGIAVDQVSLFPRKTFKGRPNGLRADLAQTIADLKPRFVRFPGGCLVHGYGLGNMYRWQHTVGPVEQRRGQPNIWGYHQTVGLGYYEYFQFCEDIGAKPLPVVPAGVCCQNADHQGGTGQRGIPLEEMQDYIQEVLDLIEWANGSATSRWGAVRAAAGHPAPFNLQYLGVGNEDHITPVFRERFKMIFDAVKAKHPEITVIGTAGPAPDGDDFVNGWKIADDLRVPIVDEHYYQAPQWFWENLHRYDSYDRQKSKVYVGEFAAHDDGRRTTLRSALAEAAYLTGLERNADVVPLTSYAPLLARRGHTQWNPNLIYFSNTQVVPTINYYVQQLFSLNSGDVYLQASIDEPSRSKATGGGVFLGTWNTQAEFGDVHVRTSAGRRVSENFETASPGWQTAAGNWSVSGGVYRQTSEDQPALSRFHRFPGDTNYTFTLRARKIGGAEGFLIGFRAVDADNYYWWNLGGWNNTRHAVEKSVNGSRTVLGGGKPGRIEANRWYEIRIEVTGPRIRCYLDGQLQHEFQDTGFVQPDFAFSSVRNSGTGDVILKFVNGSPFPKPLQVELAGAGSMSGKATRFTLKGPDPMAANDFQNPRSVVPTTESIRVEKSFKYNAPPHSLTVLRITK